MGARAAAHATPGPAVGGEISAMISPSQRPGPAPSALTPDRPARDDHGVTRHRIHARRARFSPRSARWWIPASLLVWCACASGGPEDEARGDLERVRSRLEAVAREIAEARDEHDALGRTLARSEKRAAGVRRELADLDGRLAAAHRRAEATRREITRMRAELAGRRERLARAVRASYRLSRRDPAAMLLDLESPAEIDRVLAYHAIVERAHASMIHGIAATLAGLEALEAKAAEEAAAVAALRDGKQRGFAELERERAARTDAIRALAERIRDRESRAAQLRTDERRLVELIGAIREELADVPPRIRDDKPFGQLRGKLHWPVDGPFLARYGTPRGGGLNWQGVLIRAPAGAPVRAVHRGRIAFADWLRGFGLLLIIEHGDGFMSLYGHNGTLAGEVGDWVGSGDVIATVGDSGGNPEPALYFEIRRAGKPADPRRWCARPAAAALVSP